MIDVIRKNNIIDETKTFMDFLTSEQWVETAEDGTRQEVIDALGPGIDGLTGKLINQYGADIAVGMPLEMIQWIRDSTLLWVKNKGAGNTTTEAAVVEASQVFKLKREISEMRDYYDKQVKNYAS